MRGRFYHPSKHCYKTLLGNVIIAVCTLRGEHVSINVDEGFEQIAKNYSETIYAHVEG